MHFTRLYAYSLLFNGIACVNHEYLIYLTGAYMHYMCEIIIIVTTYAVMKRKTTINYL